MSSFGDVRNTRWRFVALLAVGLMASACGGGGGSETPPPTDRTPSDTPAAPDPAEPIVLIDSVPASGTSVPTSTGEIQVAHLGASDWKYQYAGDCSPTGVAVRRQLTDVSDETPYPEVVEHTLMCSLESARDYELHIDTTAQDGTEHRASLALTTDAAGASQGVSVLDSEERSEGSISRLYERFVRNAALSEFDTAVLGSVGASIVTQIAKDKWDELSIGRTRFGTFSERVTYPGRKADGSAAMLSGLIVRPRVIDQANFMKASRIVVLSHSTGSDPSDLDLDDVWLMLGNLLAGRGYLVMAPDNWGNGQTAADDVPETYMMASRVANASLDMIDAVLGEDRYQALIDSAATKNLAVIGYSQGGHSGMALWLAHALEKRDSEIREVYIGAGPYDLHRMLRGGLLRLANRCDNSPWCDIDERQLLYYVQRWTMPGYLKYLDTNLTSADILDDDGFADSFVTGYLDTDAKFDTFKALLQLNSFANLMDLMGTVQATDTFFHIFHAEEDRTVPRQNSIDLADTLKSAFSVALHSGECNGSLFDQLSKLDTGAVHSVCALEMFNRVLKDLQPVPSPGVPSVTGDASAPWRALAESRAQQALEEGATLGGHWSSQDRELMATRLEALNTPATTELARRLREQQ